MNILVIGPVGSGKSTQAKMLADYLGLPLLNVGDLLYFASKEESVEAQEIKRAMDAGELVDEQVTLQLIEEHLKGKEHKKGTVIDGFPRTLSEAKAKLINVDKVFYINISDRQALERLTHRGRKDDMPEIIQKRLSIYHQETEQILKLYRQKGVLEEVDGERPIQEIFEDFKTRV